MTKDELRSVTIQKLKNISHERRREIEKNLHNRLLDSDFWKNAKSIGITISTGFEWDTKPIIEAAWKEGKRVCVPKCFPKDKRLEFYKLDHYGQLEVVYYQLQEPNPDKTIKVDREELDLLIVPGIVFDKFGYRVGFGGGYYDRFLVGFANKTISFVGDMQLVDKIPRETFDIPVDYVLTECSITKRELDE